MKPPDDDAERATRPEVSSWRTRRVGRLSLILIVLACIGVGWVAAPWILQERHYLRLNAQLYDENRAQPWYFIDDEIIVCFVTWRWSDLAASYDAWYLESGLRRSRLVGGVNHTLWGPDGKIIFQAESGGTIFATAPPWHWGEVEQVTPTAPWLELGITGEEWFARKTGEKSP